MLNLKQLAWLHRRIESVCPIHGIDINGAISFRDDATQQQRTAAQQFVDAFDAQVADSELAAAETAERERQAWLQIAKVKYQEAQDAFLALKARVDKIESIARAKGWNV